MDPPHGALCVCACISLEPALHRAYAGNKLTLPLHLASALGIVFAVALAYTLALAFGFAFACLPAASQPSPAMGSSRKTGSRIPGP